MGLTIEPNGGIMNDTDLPSLTPNLSSFGEGGVGGGTLPQTCVDWFNFDSMGDRYKKFHGHIALVVCIFGTVANILNVIVLTRKDMSTPINRMLTALAVADMLVMVEYIPFALHNYVLSRPEDAVYSYTWAVFVLFHANFSQIFHTISVQLTLTMAVWRYVAIKGSNRSASYCTFTRCNLCILFSYVFPIFLCIPHYIMFVIHEKTEVRFKNDIQLSQQDLQLLPAFCKQHSNSCTKTMKYHVGLSSLAQSNNELLYRIYFWTFSVVFKLIPCFVLTFFMCWLVNTLYKARKHHKMLEGKSTGYQMTTLNNEAHSVHPEESVGEQEGGQAISSLPRRKGSSCHVKIAAADATTPAPAPTTTTTTTTEMGNKTELRKSLENHNNHRPSMLQMDEKRVVGKGTSANNIINEGNLLSAPLLTGGGETTETDSRRVSEDSSVISPTDARACDNKEKNSLHPNTHLRRASSERSPGSSNSKGGRSSSGSCRRSKGFIRFPSIRRSSGQSENRGCGATPSGGPRPAPGRNSRRTDRTSKMLIAVLLLFLLTELPQGVMALLTGVYGEDFLHNCYNKWAEVWDTLALINGAINFILYCFMSKQFRLQFRLIFRLNRYCKKPKWISIATCNHNATISTTV